MNAAVGTDRAPAQDSDEYAMRSVRPYGDGAAALCGYADFKITK